MLCPVDGTPLIMANRQGVEIDYCPKCRGVWLDRGELDKIIERSGVNSGQSGHGTRSTQAYEPPRNMNQRSQTYPHMGTPYEERRPTKKYKKKRKSGLSDLLEDIFDF